MPTESYSRLFQSLLSVEEDLDLFNWQIGGAPIWDRIRWVVFYQLFDPLGGASRAQERLDVGGWSRLKISLRYLLGALKRRPSSLERDPVLFVGWQRRKRGPDGTWWDIHCDPILEHLDIGANYVEPDYEGRHFTPAHTPEIAYLDIIRLRAYLRRKAGLIEVSLSESDQSLAREASKRFEESTGKQVDVVSIVRESLRERASALGDYRSLIAHLDPELVLLVSSSSKETLIEACQQEEVPVWELQHGVLGISPAYHFPGEGRSKQLFPDRFLSWGEYWTDQVELPLDETKIEIVGFPYFDRERKRHSGQKASDRVLFLSQPSIGSELADLAVDLNGFLDTSEVVFKLHPKEEGDWRDRYPSLEDASINVVEGDQPSLYELMGGSRAQVGVGSTALFEGLGFGLRTFILNKDGIPSDQALVTAEFTTVIRSAGELVEELRKEAVTSPPVREFFRPGATERVVELIQGKLGDG